MRSKENKYRDVQTKESFSSCWIIYDSGGSCRRNGFSEPCRHDRSTSKADASLHIRTHRRNQFRQLSPSSSEPARWPGDRCWPNETDQREIRLRFQTIRYTGQNRSSEGTSGCRSCVDNYSNLQGDRKGIDCSSSRRSVWAHQPDWRTFRKGAGEGTMKTRPLRLLVLVSILILAPLASVRPASAQSFYYQYGHTQYTIQEQFGVTSTQIRISSNIWTNGTSGTYFNATGDCYHSGFPSWTMASCWIDNYSWDQGGTSNMGAHFTHWTQIDYTMRAYNVNQPSNIWGDCWLDSGSIPPSWDNRCYVGYGS